MTSVDSLIASAIGAAVPLVYASLGELVAERSGVLNLGVEGMMLVGALASFVAVAHGGGLALAVGAGMLAGVMAALAFAVLTLSLQASHVAAGLALTILGTGLSAFLGRGYVGFGRRHTGLRGGDVEASRLYGGLVGLRSNRNVRGLGGGFLL